ncbi:MAG TPA: MBL fold metallo-hydrolase [Thermoleophilia bacterium]|nr:MBL fold metallo-hydrolase [Thermoleophilia bacterium]
MKITEHVDAVRIPFSIPLPGGKALERFTWVYIVSGDRTVLIDAGVAGSWRRISEYLSEIGRSSDGVDMCVFTHSHPDHIGSAKTIKAQTNCRLMAHGDERAWIEDFDAQTAERPVPGFKDLVEGPVKIDQALADGDRVMAGTGQSLLVIHTPGHSAGHIAVLHDQDGVLCTGDALVVPDSMPTYQDAASTVKSMRALRALHRINVLCSSLDEAPIAGKEMADRIDAGLAYVGKVHRAVRESQREQPDLDLPQRTADVMQRLGLPPFAANPISQLAIASHMDAADEVFRVRS